MCKTYDAIYDLAKTMETEEVILSLNHVKIEGYLYKCDSKDGKCYQEVVTLKDAVVECPKSNYRQEYKWINIPSKHIQAFAFKCCKK